MSRPNLAKLVKPVSKALIQLETTLDPKA